MKAMFKIAAVTAIAFSVATGAFSAEFTKGKVKKLDEKAGKVTLIHEDLKNLDMPGMTMVFRIGDGVDAGKLKAGSDIEFVADRVDGKLTVTEVK